MISAVDPRSLDATREGLIDLAREYRIVVGGAAANRADFGEDILTLTGSPVDEAERVTQLEHRGTLASNSQGGNASDGVAAGRAFRGAS